MEKKKRIYYQRWREGDFASSPRVQDMSGQARLYYRAMLQVCFHRRELGLPDDPGRVAGLLSCRRRDVVRHWSVLREAFVSHDGRLYHPIVDADLGRESRSGRGDILDASSSSESEEDASSARPTVKREEWKTKEDAIRSARMMCGVKRISDFRRAHVVRNALDVWYRRRSFRDPVAVFYDRVSRGYDYLAAAGSESRREEAEAIVSEWNRNGGPRNGEAPN